MYKFNIRLKEKKYVSKKNMLVKKICVVIVAVIAIILLIIEYINRTRKMKKYDLEKLYRCKDMGEALLNFFSSLYIPAVFYIFSYKWNSGNEYIRGIIIVILFSLLVELNMRIYMYKKKIRYKEKYDR